MIAITENTTSSTGDTSLTQSGVPAPTRARVRVWLTDDNLGIRNSIAQLLDRSGEFDCERQFHSAEALLEGLANEPAPDVILLDVEMGGMSGVEALRPIRVLAPRVRVLIVTSIFDSIYEQRSVRDGASAFLIKADAPHNLTGEIHRALASPVRLPENAPAGSRQAAESTATLKLSTGRRLRARLALWRAHVSMALFGQLTYSRTAATPK